MSNNPFESRFDSYGEAIQLLESRKFLCQDGAIIPPGIEYEPKLDEKLAIDYLTHEWSWSYLG